MDININNLGFALNLFSALVGLNAGSDYIFYKIKKKEYPDSFTSLITALCCGAVCGIIAFAVSYIMPYKIKMFVLFLLLSSYTYMKDIQKKKKHKKKDNIRSNVFYALIAIIHGSVYVANELCNKYESNYDFYGIVAMFGMLSGYFTFIICEKLPSYVKIWMPFCVAIFNNYLFIYRKN